jgi:hypothetical protein
MRFRLIVLLFGLTFAGCHPGPVVGGRQPAAGTIAGLVTASDASTPLVGRKVSAVDVASGRRYDTTTGEDGGYSMKVPEGTYRLEVELRSGEALSKQPDETHVKNSDIDADRNFVVMPKS